MVRCCSIIGQPEWLAIRVKWGNFVSFTITNEGDEENAKKEAYDETDQRSFAT